MDRELSRFARYWLDHADVRRCNPFLDYRRDVVFEHPRVAFATVGLGVRDGVRNYLIKA
jgi:hypothetical protein